MIALNLNINCGRDDIFMIECIIYHVCINKKGLCIYFLIKELINLGLDLCLVTW